MEEDNNLSIMWRVWPLTYYHTAKIGTWVHGSQGRCAWCLKMGWIMRTLEEKIGNRYSRQWGQQMQASGWFFFIEWINELIPGRTLTHIRQSLHTGTHMTPSVIFKVQLGTIFSQTSSLTLLNQILLHQNLFRTFGNHCTNVFFSF